MIARKSHLSKKYRKWNTKWGAPFGRWLRRILTPSLRWRRPMRPWVGYFGYQDNNTTREFEYPWCYYAAQLRPGMIALEIGGSLSGFQFVLSSEGVDVVNLDPGKESRGKGWPLTENAHQALNRSFGTTVTLKHCFIENAQLSDSSFDRVFAISVLEHIPSDDLDTLMSHIHRVLKPDGLLVATIDLFLNIQPFEAPEANEYGTNVDVKDLIAKHGFLLVEGDHRELFGYPEFDANNIKDRVKQGEYLIGTYPVLVQCIVCRKT